MTQTTTRTNQSVHQSGTADDEHLTKLAQKLLLMSKNRMNKLAHWYPVLGNQEREFLDIIILSAINDYLDWANLPEPIEKREKISADHLFSIAPIETARAISLANVLEATRIVVDIITENIDIVAPKGKERDYYEAALYYSREVSFSAASVYAEVAETRSRWMAREESLALNALLSGNLDLSLQSRMSAYDWDDSTIFFAAVGRIKADTHSEMKAGFHQAQAHLAVQNLGAEVIMGSHSNSIFTVVVGGPSDENFETILHTITPLFCESACLCVGPRAQGYTGASHSLRAAYNGFFASVMEIDPPYPLYADDIVADRVLFGDSVASDQLYNIYKILKNSGKRNEILPTVEHFLLKNSSLDRTAQDLVIHPNTVRYRLRRATELTGWDPMNPDEAYSLRIALKIGRYRESQEDAADTVDSVPKLDTRLQ